MNKSLLTWQKSLQPIPWRQSQREQTKSDPVETKIAEKITKDPSKSTHENAKNSTTTLILQPRSIPNRIYIPPEKQQQVINELLLL